MYYFQGSREHRPPWGASQLQSTKRSLHYLRHRRSLLWFLSFQTGLLNLIKTKLKSFRVFVRLISSMESFIIRVTTTFTIARANPASKHRRKFYVTRFRLWPIFLKAVLASGCKRCAMQ